jgi:PAS domain-containing protein
LSAAFGICRCTLGGRFLDVNPALIAMLGHESVEDLLQLDARREVFVNPQSWTGWPRTTAAPEL